MHDAIGDDLSTVVMPDDLRTSVGHSNELARVASEPEALLQVLTNTIYRLKRAGLDAGPLSQWLYSILAEAGLRAKILTAG